MTPMCNCGNQTLEENNEKKNSNKNCHYFEHLDALIYHLGQSTCVSKQNSLFKTWGDLYINNSLGNQGRSVNTSKEIDNHTA